jgi:WD40 repeat protein
MHHVFVSYSRSDRAWVDDLASRLRRNGIKVWIDQRDIPATVPWFTEVQDAIEEAALFLCCTSPAYRTSENCSAEFSAAIDMGKPRFVVRVGDDLDACASQITQTVREISPIRGRRTELRVLARDWDRAGRPRNRLASLVVRRRLERGLEFPPPASDTEQSFLRASKHRTWLRAGITALVIALIAAGGGTTVVLRTEQDSINNANSQTAAAYSQEQQSIGQVTQDPYRGLQLAAADGGIENETDDQVISEALSQPTPDDSFTVPQARDFAVRPVGAEVLVAAANGQEWQHGTAGTAVGQPATRLNQAQPSASAAPSATPSPAAASGPDGLTATASSTSGLVQVFRDGQLYRVIDFNAVAGALAFSPDGRFLAASIGEQVEVADVDSALVRIHLRGATGDLLDVAWSADGSHVWALDDGRVFSWSTGAAYTLVDNLSADFNSVLPAATPGAVWIVAAHTLTEISVTTAAVLARITIDDTLDSAGAAPDGSLALVSGLKYLWVVPLSGVAGRNAIRHVTLPGCDIGRPTFASDATAYVPCIGGSLLRVSLPSGRVTSVITVSSAGVFGATAVPGTDLVYAGDEEGYLYVVQGGQTWATEIQASECDMEVQRIAVDSGDGAVLPVGSGSGEATCTKVGTRSPGANPASQGSWTWNAVLDSQQLSIYASAVAFSPDGGAFAIGYSDGTITMYPTGNPETWLIDDTADGMIRDMLTLPDGDLIAVTDTGMVQRLQLCDSCMSDAALSQVAAARLQLAVRLGLARPDPAPAQSGTVG